MLDSIINIRPAVKDLVANYKDFSLYDYSKILVQKGSHGPQILNTSVNIIAEDITKRFLSIQRSDVEKTLVQLGSVDTAGHGGILSEDTITQGYLIGATGAKQLDIPCYIAFACGVVPMNNNTWPRGFFSKGKRVSIFPKSFDRLPFHECPAFQDDLIKKAKTESKDKDSQALLDFIQNLPNVYRFEDFADQSCYINFNLWKQINKATLPSLLPLPLEHITAKLVIENIKQDGLLNRILFEEPFRKLVIDKLRGLPGTWDEEKHKGTHFFWARNSDFRYSGLWETEGVLQGSFNVEYSKEEIIEKLNSKKIVPGVFLSLLSLVCSGFKCLGGYHQIGYLPEYKKRLCELGAMDCKKTDENVWQYFSPALSYGPVFLTEKHSIENSEGSIIPYSGMRPKYIDSMLRDNVTDTDIEKLKYITMYQGLELNFDRLKIEIR